MDSYRAAKCEPIFTVNFGCERLALEGPPLHRVRE